MFGPPILLVIQEPPRKLSVVWIFNRLWNELKHLLALWWWGFQFYYGERDLALFTGRILSHQELGVDHLRISPSLKSAIPKRNGLVRVWLGLKKIQDSPELNKFQQPTTSREGLPVWCFFVKGITSTRVFFAKISAFFFVWLLFVPEWSLASLEFPEPPHPHPLQPDPMRRARRQNFLTSESAGDPRDVHDTSTVSSTAAGDPQGGASGGQWDHPSTFSSKNNAHCCLGSFPPHPSLWHWYPMILDIEQIENSPNPGPEYDHPQIPDPNNAKSTYRLKARLWNVSGWVLAPTCESSCEKPNFEHVVHTGSINMGLFPFFSHRCFQAEGFLTWCWELSLVIFCRRLALLCLASPCCATLHFLLWFFRFA